MRSIGADSSHPFSGQFELLSSRRRHRVHLVTRNIYKYFILSTINVLTLYRTLIERKEGRKEGRKERRKDGGRKEGRKVGGRKEREKEGGRKERKKEGRREGGREGGREERRKERKEGYLQKLPNIIICLIKG